LLSVDLIRGQRSEVVRGLTKRLDAVEVESMLSEILLLDDRRRELERAIGDLRQQRKAKARAFRDAKEAGASSTSALPASDRNELTSLETELVEVRRDLDERMKQLPNVPADDVMPGGKEHNRVLRAFGEQPTIERPRDHPTIARDLGLVDFARGVKLSGAGFWIYTGMGARLEWALIDWFIEQNVEAGYEFYLPPHLLLHSAGVASGQFPKFAADVYYIDRASRLDNVRDQFLLPTAETAILGMFQGERMDETALPIKAFAYTPCYRLERAGTHSDEKGTVRGHQFNKVEVFQFTVPEAGERTLDELVGHVEGLVQKLGLHFRTSVLAAGDASAAMRKTIDVEVWMPSVQKYKEVSSVSWAGDYQARRAGIRLTREGKSTREFVHTLNGSALATSRVFPAILEQFQLPDGTVRVPEVLRSRLGTDRIQGSPAR